MHVMNSLPNDLLQPACFQVASTQYQFFFLSLHLRQSSIAFIYCPPFGMYRKLKQIFPKCQPENIRLTSLTHQSYLLFKKGGGDIPDVQQAGRDNL